MSSMIIKTCLVHCLFRSHPQRQPKRSPFLQGSGSTGEAFPVAGWGMPQFSRNLARPTWDPWDGIPGMVPTAPGWS